MPFALDGIRTCTSRIRAHRASDYTTRVRPPRVSRNKHFSHSPVSSTAKQSCMKTLQLLSAGPRRQASARTSAESDEACQRKTKDRADDMRKKVPFALDGIRTCTSRIRAHRASDYTTRVRPPRVSLCVCVCVCVCVTMKRKCQPGGVCTRVHVSIKWHPPMGQHSNPGQLFWPCGPSAAGCWVWSTGVCVCVCVCVCACVRLCVLGCDFVRFDLWVHVNKTSKAPPSARRKKFTWKPTRSSRSASFLIFEIPFFFFYLLADSRPYPIETASGSCSGQICFETGKQVLDWYGTRAVRNKSKTTRQSLVIISHDGSLFLSVESLEVQSMSLMFCFPIQHARERSFHAFSILTRLRTRVHGMLLILLEVTSSVPSSHRSEILVLHVSVSFANLNQ